MNVNGIGASHTLGSVERGGASTQSGGAACPHKPEEKLDQLMQLLRQVLAENSAGGSTQGGAQGPACSGPSAGGSAGGQQGGDILQKLLEKLTQELQDKEARQCHRCKPHEMAAQSAEPGGTSDQWDKPFKPAAAELA